MISQDENEYSMFMTKLFNKINELRNDYDNLTPQNKLRVNQEAERIVYAMGFSNFINKYIKK